MATTAKSYPVSHIYKRHIGKKCSELPEKLQNAIWDYPLAVQELRDWREKDIRALFRRLNYVVERLNKQELRHSQYFGEFNEAVELLTRDPFWDDIKLFTRHDSQRMKDIEFVSELFVIVVDGIQDQQRTLDQFYADYDVNFPSKARNIAQFRQVISSLRTLADLFNDSRFGKKADFYGLFAAVQRSNANRKGAVDLGAAVAPLTELSNNLDEQPERFEGLVREYYATVIEGPNKLAKRVRRADILYDLIHGALE